MKSVAFVFDGLGFGGIERIGSDYIRMLTELGYKVDVYNLNPSANDLVDNLPTGASYFPYKLSRKGCPETYSYGVQKWWWGKYAYALISPALSIAQFVRKNSRRRLEYDVAIAISGHINDLSFVTKEFIKSKKKICWCHGNVISYLAICDAYPMLYKKIDEIVTLSSAGEKDIYAGKKFLYDKRITKIYNPTYIMRKPINDDKVIELKRKYGKFTLMIARFESGKGHDIAIKSMKCLKEKGINQIILFAGDGKLLNQVKEFAKEEGMSENCVFLGNCYDIQNYIAASHINLLTSRWEGLPTVIIEAMTMGKPCIMTNTDDGECSHNGEYCMLNEIDDVEGIANSLYSLYADRAVYEKYVNLSLKRAESFKPEEIVKKITSLIET